MFSQYKIKNYNFKLVFFVSLLTILGIMVIGSANPAVQSKQVLGFFVGLVIMVVISLLDYQVLLNFSFVYYVSGCFLLLLVKFLGHSSKGAQRWFSIAGITIQPSELAKIVIIVFFASYLNKYTERINDNDRLLKTLGFVAIPLCLILSQPDLSTTIVTAFIFVSLLFIAGLSYKIIVRVLAVIVPAFIIAIILVATNVIDLLHGYQMERISAWLYPDAPQNVDKARQQVNSIMAIGSGQMFGKGLNNTDAASLNNTHYISESHTDFIFSVIGEELGFIGSVAVIVLLACIVYQCIKTGMKARDLSGQLICYGMASWIAFQSFVNICVTTGLMPNTGLTLPFVSYGLTSLLSLLIGIGLVLNVGLQCKKYY
ncbi:FtsW/RodA/SpoVE family cell cycle protein [Lachnobacterium bovis]|uniref:Rod shape determining protein RodA n=1 Tax=Lachnobacterium bovis TaxID=140626 RepID=A0A1H9PYR5_9FIRM|nr:FtsW/RodA/SpoVE family cell cycle protein [Lachnobacterium bovis]SER53332.1 rod shape determining protein RodA [Lachnobacterium bovis]